jgi:hypothetical protein
MSPTTAAIAAAAASRANSTVALDDVSARKPASNPRTIHPVFHLPPGNALSMQHDLLNTYGLRPGDRGVTGISLSAI